MVPLRKIFCYCGIRASFGLENGKPTHCVKHKKDNMYCLVIKPKCKSNEQGILCPVSANRNYEGYCATCFVNLFPAHPKSISVRKKSKERAVVSFVHQHFEGFSHDRPIYLDYKGGCCETKRRIDLRKLINSTMLCIEVDENQHKYYDAQDEEDRYDNLFMDFSGKYIFIRYNPDPYKDRTGKKRSPQIKTRLEKLKKETERQLKRIENETWWK